MSGRRIVYWDSCIFIAYLKDELRKDPKDMQGVNELATLFDMGQIDIATSAIAFTEVLETTITAEKYKMFCDLFSRRNIHLIDVNRKIAEISHQIRNHYYLVRNPTISTPDALHLATAIWFQCDTFYTFDGEADPLGLLQLDQPIADIYDIPILKPAPTNPPQLQLGL